MNTSMIMAIIGAAGAFGSLMTKYQVTAMVSKSITAMTSSPIVFLLLFNLVMLLVGMFMEANAAIILITPVLLPVSKAFGIDPLFFGLLTPPVGINLFVACGIKGNKMSDILKKPMWIYLGICLVMLAIFTYCPKVTLLFHTLFSS